MMVPQVGERYRHYKSSGGEDYTYEIIGLGKNTETEEMVVIYKPLYDSLSSLGGSQYWVRPISMRDEEIEWQGKRMKRFTKIL